MTTRGRRPGTSEYIAYEFKRRKTKTKIQTVSWFVLAESFDENLLQELFLQQNEEALLLLIAKSLKRKEYVRIRYCYESTILNNI